MKVASLLRIQSDDNQTLGELCAYDGHEMIFSCKSLELPDNRNKRNISRIPAGAYLCTKRYSEKYKWHYEILNVPNRSFILIHAGNYNRDTKGCILLGSSFSDINSDGYLDVTGSRNTIDNFMTVMDNEPFYLTITDLDYHQS